MVSNLEYSSKIITIMYNHTINEGLELVIECVYNQNGLRFI